MNGYDFLKYSTTGIASPDMTAYDKMRAMAAVKKPETAVHYGFKIDKSVSDPSDAVIYTHDACIVTV